MCNFKFTVFVFFNLIVMGFFARKSMVVTLLNKGIVLRLICCCNTNMLDNYGKGLLEVLNVKCCSEYEAVIARFINFDFSTILDFALKSCGLWQILHITEIWIH